MEVINPIDGELFILSLNNAINLKSSLIWKHRLIDSFPDAGNR